MASRPSTKFYVRFIVSQFQSVSFFDYQFDEDQEHSRPTRQRYSVTERAVRDPPDRSLSTVLSFCMVVTTLNRANYYLTQIINHCINHKELISERLFRIGHRIKSFLQTNKFSSLFIQAEKSTCELHSFKSLLGHLIQIAQKNTEEYLRICVCIKVVGLIKLH